MASMLEFVVLVAILAGELGFTVTNTTTNESSRRARPPRSPPHLAVCILVILVCFFFGAKIMRWGGCLTKGRDRLSTSQGRTPLQTAELGKTTTKAVTKAVTEAETEQLKVVVA